MFLGTYLSFIGGYFVLISGGFNLIPDQDENSEEKSVTKASFLLRSHWIILHIITAYYCTFKLTIFDILKFSLKQ